MIVSAAVKGYSILLDKEFLLPVHRHKDARFILSQISHYHYDYKDMVEGFLTDEDKFLDRIEAADHAYECGQLVEDAETERITCLMSEDLW